MASGIKKLSRTFVWILMGLLIVGLMGFGAVNFTGSASHVATVGNQTVTIQEYVRALQQEQRALQAQTGEALPMAQMRELGLDRAILARLIGTAAIDDEVAALGVSIGDENVQRELLQIDAFRNLQGEFEAETYRFQLEAIGMTPARFEADLRAETARTLVQGAVIAGANMPASMTSAITDFIGARRSFTWAQLTEADVALTQVIPTDEELRAFYEANTDQFMLPETKKITYARLTPDMLVDEVELDETALRELYDTRADQYQQPARRIVERLVFADTAEAENALAQLSVGGTTFELLVEQRDLNLSDIDLGDVTIEQLGAAGEPVFEAAVGEVVGPLPSTLGPALFRVNGRLEARVTTFEDALPELREELAMERARRLIASQAEGIDDLLAGGATLEELESETDMQVGQIDWTPDASDGIAAYDSFRTVAAAVTEDDFPAVEFLEDDGLFALRLDAVLEERPQPFDAAKPDVIAAVQAQRLANALQSEAERIVAELATSGDFLEIGLEVKVENGLMRTAFIDNTPLDLMPQVFEMQKGDLRIMQAEGRVLIVRLDDILPPEENEEMAQLTEALQAQLDQTLAQNLFDAFTRDVQLRAQPTVDEQALNAVAHSYP